MTQAEIDYHIEMSELEDAMWNHLDDDFDGMPYCEVDETCFAIEQNFPPTYLTEEQWNNDRL